MGNSTLLQCSTPNDKISTPLFGCFRGKFEFFLMRMEDFHWKWIIVKVNKPLGENYLTQKLLTQIPNPTWLKNYNFKITKQQFYQVYLECYFSITCVMCWGWTCLMTCWICCIVIVVGTDFWDCTMSWAGTPLFVTLKHNNNTLLNNFGGLITTHFREMQLCRQNSATCKHWKLFIFLSLNHTLNLESL